MTGSEIQRSLGAIVSPRSTAVDSQRLAEVERQAQGAQASAFVSSGLPSIPRNTSSFQQDRFVMSSEAASELASPQTPQQARQNDQMVSALREAWKLERFDTTKVLQPFTSGSHR